MFVVGIILAVAAAIAIIAGIFAKQLGALIPGIVVGIIGAIFIITQLFFTQDVGQSSVLRSWTGQIVGDPVTSSGIHSKAPWDHVITFDIRNQRVVFTNPKLSTGDNSGGDADGREIAVIDADGVSSDVDITVRYNLDPNKVTEIYSNFKDENNLKSTLIFNDIRSVVRSEAGKLHTLDLLTKRDAFATAIQSELASRWAKSGVLVDEVAIQQVEPPASVKTSYADAQKSQIEVQKAQNDLAAVKVSAQQKVAQAQAEADANKLLDGSLTDKILQQRYLDTLANLAEAGNLVITDGSSSNLINIPAK